MILSGTTLGFIGVAALLFASLLMGFLDKKEKGRGNTEKARFLSRLALVLFIAAFLGGVGVTLVSGVKPREEGQGITGGPMGGGSPGAEQEGDASPPPMAQIGKINEAEVKQLQDKIAKDPKDVRSLERLGHLYLQSQDFENVFKTAHDALQIDPKSVESRVHLGMVFFAMRDLDKSIEQFDQALAIDPKNSEGLLFKGIVQFQGKDDMKGAKETWEKFMKVSKPTDPGRVRVEMFLKTINEQLKSANPS
jgi:tetratricopeptide repeat protein